MDANAAARMKEDGWIVLPILPRYRMFLTIAPKTFSEFATHLGSRSHTVGQPFVKAFRHVWKKLPNTVRNALLQHWRSWPGRLRIELSAFQMRRETLAHCGDNGYTFRFRPFFDLYEPELQHLVIAHELAHAYFVTLGVEQGYETFLDSKEHPQFGDARQIKARYRRLEARVDDLVAEWGFPKRKTKVR